MRATCACNGRFVNHEPKGCEVINTLKRMRGEEQGFTLIELLVVILIIAILVLVGLPAFLGQQEKARKSEAQQQLRTAYTTAKSEAVFKDGKFVTGVETAGDLEARILSKESSIDGNKFNVTTASADEFTATYKWGDKADEIATMVASQGGVNIEVE